MRAKKMLEVRERSRKVGNYSLIMGPWWYRQGNWNEIACKRRVVRLREGKR
jgi:hypothetical protein